MYRQRAVIGVLGPARVAEARAERIERQAVSLGAGLALAGYGAVVLDGGFTSEACRRGARQHDGLVVDAWDATGRVDGQGEGAEVSVGSGGPRSSLPVGAGGPRAPVAGLPVLSAMDRFLGVADAVMVLPGDVRSLALLMLIWSWGAEPSAPYRQVILVGEGWAETVRHLAEAAGLDPRTRAMVTFAPEVSEAIEALRYYVAPAGDLAASERSGAA